MEQLLALIQQQVKILRIQMELLVVMIMIIMIQETEENGMKKTNFHFIKQTSSLSN